MTESTPQSKPIFENGVCSVTREGDDVVVTITKFEKLLGNKAALYHARDRGVFQQTLVQAAELLMKDQEEAVARRLLIVDFGGADSATTFPASLMSQAAEELRPYHIGVARRNAQGATVESSFNIMKVAKKVIDLDDPAIEVTKLSIFRGEKPGKDTGRS